MTDATPPAWQVEYFDGRSAQAHPVVPRMLGTQLQLLRPGSDEVLYECPARQVTWPEPTRHGARIAQLPHGGSLQTLDSSAWDRWVASHPDPAASLVVQAQRSWHAVLWLTLLLVGGLFAAYQWGLPLAAKGALALTPRSVDSQVGELAWESLEGRWFQPSRVPEATQKRLREGFAQAVQRATLGTSPLGSEPVPFKVLFRQSSLGPNALAFPDGTIVVTDELVTLLAQHEPTLIGVLAHEWGHVRHRHSMRMLIQASAVGLIATAVLGDFSSLLAAAPAMLGQLGYSRELEREADDTAIEVLRANGIAPSVMITLFDKLDEHAKKRGDDRDGPGIALSSHPSDAERRARFAQP